MRAHGAGKDPDTIREVIAVRRTFLMFSALMLVVSACGDDDEAIFVPTTTETTTGSTAVATTAPTGTTAADPTTTSEPPTTTSTAPATTTQAPGPTIPVTTHPGLPPASSRSLIPVDEIDEGWVAAVYSADKADPHEDGPSALYLASPSGDLYELAYFEAGGAEPFDVGNIANSGSHVLVQLSDPATFTARIAAVEIPSGTVRDITTVESGAAIGTTLPTGRDAVVLHTTFSPTLEHLEVYRTNGALFADIISLPSQFPGLTWLYGLDGTYLLVGDTTGLLVYSNDGTFVRTLDTPPGYCEPRKWWDADTILAGCIPQDVLNADGFYHVLWLIPIDGSPGTPLTAPPPPGWDLVEFGHADAWRAGGQTMLQWWGDCAARGIQVLQPDGTGVGIGGPGGGLWIHARAGDDLVVHAIGGCGTFYGPVHLIRTDGSLVRTLVPQISGYQGVTAVAGMIPVP